ncbi:MAG: hypothetical protein ACLQF0_09090 [Dissulfurispiraceae bacterium]
MLQRRMSMMEKSIITEYVRMIAEPLKKLSGDEEAENGKVRMR